MLPRDPLGPAPVARTGPVLALEALGDPRQQAFQRALAGQLGKTMPAQVLARLADGSAVVRVAGSAARMPLPPGAEVGSEVPLKLLALSPRPTFEYDGRPVEAALLPEAAHPDPAPGRAGAAAPAASPAAAAAQGDVEVSVGGHEAADELVYRPDGRAPAAAAPSSARAAAAHAATAALPTGAASAGAQAVQLSAAGRVLGSVLGAVLGMERPARAIATRAALQAAPGADPATLAPALRQALEHSGLFYEAHLAEWAQGRRTLEQLGAEPQMRERPVSPAEPDTAQLINLQLSTHESGRLAWDGQWWPGQPLHWEIERDQPREDGDGGPDGEKAEPGWTSRLRLQLGSLGELDASVLLQGGKVAIHLAAAPDTAALLRGHAAELEQALAAAGSPLASLLLRSTEPPDA